MEALHCGQPNECDELVFQLFAGFVSGLSAKVMNDYEKSANRYVDYQRQIYASQAI
jgi:hypothetical protein